MGRGDSTWSSASLGHVRSSSETTETDENSTDRLRLAVSLATRFVPRRRHKRWVVCFAFGRYFTQCGGGSALPEVTLLSKQCYLGTIKSMRKLKAIPKTHSQHGQRQRQRLNLIRTSKCRGWLNLLEQGQKFGRY